MSPMDGMPMPGGGTMSMVWMRMPGQTWPGVAPSFLGMWIVMMVAMMLPSLVPMLWRYRESVRGAGARHFGWLTAVVSVGYFFVWTALGMAVFPLGVALAAVESRQPALSRAMPIAVGAVVLIAGVLQLTSWKSPAHAHPRVAGVGTAWRHGVRLGVDCARCCAGLMAIPLVVGIMDLRVMGVVTVAISAERLAPARLHVARGLGIVGIAAGMLLIMRAAVLRS